MINWRKKAPLGAFFLSAFCSPVALSLCELPNTTHGLSSQTALEQPKVEQVKVTSVYDGDTLTLSDGRRVRLIGVNTPELQGHGLPAQPLAQEARDYLAGFVLGRPAQLVVGKQAKDHYGRVLGHIFSTRGENMTAMLLIKGYGFQVLIPPNVQFEDCYRQAEAKAITSAEGVWGHPYYRIKGATDANLEGGYVRLFGAVERVTVLKKVIWVDLQGAVSLKLEERSSKYLAGPLLDELVARSKSRDYSDFWLETEGWLSDRTQWKGNMPELVKKGQRKRFQLKVFHSADLKRVDVARAQSLNLAK